MIESRDTARVPVAIESARPVPEIASVLTVEHAGAREAEEHAVRCQTRVLCCRSQVDAVVCRTHGRSAAPEAAQRRKSDSGIRDRRCRRDALTALARKQATVVLPVKSNQPVGGGSALSCIQRGDRGKGIAQRSHIARSGRRVVYEPDAVGADGDAYDAGLDAIERIRVTGGVGERRGR